MAVNVMRTHYAVQRNIRDAPGWCILRWPGLVTWPGAPRTGSYAHTGILFVYVPPLGMYPEFRSVALNFCLFTRQLWYRCGRCGFSEERIRLWAHTATLNKIPKDILLHICCIFSGPSFWWHRGSSGNSEEGICRMAHSYRWWHLWFVQQGSLKENWGKRTKITEFKCNCIWNKSAIKNKTALLLKVFFMEQQEWGIPGAGRRLRHIYVLHVHGLNVNISTWAPCGK